MSSLSAPLQVWSFHLLYLDRATLIRVSQSNSELCHKSYGFIMTHMPIDATRLQAVLVYIPRAVRVQRLLAAAEPDRDIMIMHHFENLVRIQLCLLHFRRQVDKSATPEVRPGCTLKQILKLLLQTLPHTATRAKQYNVDAMADLVVASMPSSWALENLTTDVGRVIQHLQQTYRDEEIHAVRLGGLLELIRIAARRSTRQRLLGF